jgi:hypothetical protein
MYVCAKVSSPDLFCMTLLGLDQCAGDGAVR